MPRGNGTGPAGMGPMTGKAAGFCAGSQTPGYTNSVGRGRFGMGQGGGRGGRGRNNQFYATGLPGWVRGSYGASAPSATTAKQELAGLKQQAEHLQSVLEGINSRIEQLETQSKSPD